MGYFSRYAKSAIATCECHPWHWNLNLKMENSQNSCRKIITHKRNKKLPEIRKFQYSDLVAATNGFSADGLLGRGSHGSVYRATLDGGKLVAAVKTTKFRKPSAASLRHHDPNCRGCSNCSSPAENEIEILSRIRSPRRLVNIIGFSTDSDHNKLIVVQYMPNGSLCDLLHSASEPPGWTRRVRFALQVAKAVRALHSSNPPVIHRDIKSSNVLIDEDWNARLSDFGLALRGHVEDVRVRCTPPAGTLGYLDPCYLAPGDLSAKSDVFSFGIMLLEIISGRNAIDVRYSPPSVVEWAVPLIKKGGFLGICDPRVGTPSDPKVIQQLAVLAARCVRSKAERRPAMLEVVECLKQVRKRIHASPIWRSLRRRVARGEKARPLRRWEVGDGSEEVGRVVKGGSRRNRKVSSVYETSEEGECRNNQVVRSKSIGCESEMKMQMQMQSILNPNGMFGRRKGGLDMMKLSKSRSMGFLRDAGAIMFQG